MSNSSICPYRMLLLEAWVNLKAMAIKGYSTFPKAPRLEPYCQMVSCHIQNISLVVGVLPLRRDVVCVFYSPKQSGQYTYMFLSISTLFISIRLFIYPSKIQKIWDKYTRLQRVSAPTTTIQHGTTPHKLTRTKILQNFWLTLIQMIFTEYLSSIIF